MHAKGLQTLAGDIAKRGAQAGLQAAELLAIPLQRAVDTGNDRIVDLPEPVVAIHGLLVIRVAAGELTPDIAIRLPDGGKNAIALPALQLQDAAFLRTALQL
jgi:hypothetical protein